MTPSRLAIALGFLLPLLPFFARAARADPSGAASRPTATPQEIEQQAVAKILAAPGNSAAAATAQLALAEALLAQGKNEEALAAAKGYYFLAPQRDTEKAIQLLCVALAAARPNDAAVVRRFKAEQWAGASPNPATQPTPTLASIKVDPSHYEQALRDLRVTGYGSLVARGNLLLLCDKPEDAQATFEQAFELAGNQELTGAIENIARAIRARWGCVGPANAYILSLRKGKAAEAKTPATRATGTVP